MKQKNCPFHRMKADHLNLRYEGQKMADAETGAKSIQFKFHEYS